MLIVSDWYLPAYKAGGPIVSCYNMVKALRGQMRIAVLCGDRDYQDKEAFEGLACNKWLQRDGIYVYYLSRKAQKYNRVADLIGVNAPSILYINGIFSKVFSIYPLLAGNRLRMRILVAPRGMMAPGALGIKSLKKRSFLLLARFLGLYRGIGFHATHEHEAQHIRKQVGAKASVKVLPNLPGMPESRSRTEAYKRERFANKEVGSLRLLTVARIAPEKNIDFALDCLAELPGELSVEWSHVGPVYSEAYFRSCRQKKLPEGLSVRWLGSRSPQELERIYSQNELFFLPTRGENYGHAIVESLLRSVPVLISDQAPWRDLSAKGFGADLPLGDKKAFVDYICTVAMMGPLEYRKAFEGLGDAFEKQMSLDRLVQGYVSWLT